MDNERKNIRNLIRSGSNVSIDDLVISNISDASRLMYHSNNIFEESELRKGIYNKRYRYGMINPYQNLSNCREFLFFTKPDLNIYQRTDEGHVDEILNDELSSYLFWTELEMKMPEVLHLLQGSFKKSTVSPIDPFNHLLENMVQSNLDVPGISAESIETASNMYGVNFTYRGSSEASDDGFDFSLEFKDTKYLPVYYFFKAYEEYEKLKHHGIIGPWIGHIANRVLHDQYSIYKFLVDEDMETIIYYAKYYGVKSKNLPRDVFNNVQFDNGLSYSIDFNAAFVEDMNPEILIDFNAISYPFWSTLKYDVDVYDEVMDRADMTPVKGAIVALEKDGRNNYEVFGYDNLTIPTNETLPNKLTKTPGGFAYKLKWRGDDKI